MHTPTPDEALRKYDSTVQWGSAHGPVFITQMETGHLMNAFSQLHNKIEKLRDLGVIPQNADERYIDNLSTAYYPMMRELRRRGEGVPAQPTTPAPRSERDEYLSRLREATPEHYGY